MKLLKIGDLIGGIFVYLRSLEDIRRFVDEFVPGYTKIQGIADLSNMSREGQSVLLKFIEEGIEDIVCYASRDNVSPVLMSRFDKIERNDSIKVGYDSFAVYAQSVLDQGLKDAVQERDFVFKSAEHLDSYLVFRNLSKGVRSRVGKLL